MNVGWYVHIHLKVAYEPQVGREERRVKGLDWYLAWAPTNTEAGMSIGLS